MFDPIALLTSVCSGLIVGTVTARVGAAASKTARDEAKAETLAEFRGTIVAHIAELRTGLNRLEATQAKLFERFDVKIDQIPCQFECRFDKAKERDRDG